jgi:hypothetical protein
MSGASIALEVEAALREVAVDTGDGTFEVALKAPGTSNTNPWEGSGFIPGASTNVPAMVSRFARNLIDGTLIRATDKRVMIAGTAPRPDTNWTVTIGGVSHAIVNVIDLAPSGVVLYYELQARA